MFKKLTDSQRADIALFSQTLIATCLVLIMLVLGFELSFQIYWTKYANHYLVAYYNGSVCNLKGFEPGTYDIKYDWLTDSIIVTDK